MVQFGHFKNLLTTKVKKAKIALNICIPTLPCFDVQVSWCSNIKDILLEFGLIKLVSGLKDLNERWEDFRQLLAICFYCCVH